MFYSFVAYVFSKNSVCFLGAFWRNKCVFPKVFHGFPTYVFLVQCFFLAPYSSRPFGVAGLLFFFFTFFKVVFMKKKNASWKPD